MLRVVCFPLIALVAISVMGSPGNAESYERISGCFQEARFLTEKKSISKRFQEGRFRGLRRWHLGRRFNLLSGMGEVNDQLKQIFSPI